MTKPHLSKCRQQRHGAISIKLDGRSGPLMENPLYQCVVRVVCVSFLFCSANLGSQCEVSCLLSFARFFFSFLLSQPSSYSFQHRAVFDCCLFDSGIYLLLLLLLIEQCRHAATVVRNFGMLFTAMSVGSFPFASISLPVSTTASCHQLLFGSYCLIAIL